MSALENEAAESTPAGSIPAARDGWVELLFETALQPGRIDADGYMDFLDRGLLVSASAGQTLARVHPPEVGDPPGAPAALALGAGVTLEADGSVVARRAGVVHSAPGQLDVVDRHVHLGAVDLHSGHLDLSGSVIVRGDVERLLHVHATGDVEILGAVSGAVRAEGSVRVTGNVRGGDGARLAARGDVTLRSCESADITASVTLRVKEAVNSRLVAAQVVVAGRLRGGSAVAESSVVVKEAGTTAGSATLVQAGEPVEMPGPDDVQRAVVMQKLRRMAERGGVREASGVRGDSRAKGGKLGRAQALLSAEDARVLSQRAARRQQLCRTASLQVGLAHAGVELRIGAARLMLEQTTPGARYTWDSETGQLRAERTRA